MVEEMMRAVCNELTVLRITGVAHWIADENPQSLTKGLLEFLGASQ